MVFALVAVLLERIIHIFNEQSAYLYIIDIDHSCSSLALAVENDVPISRAFAAPRCPGCRAGRDVQAVLGIYGYVIHSTPVDSGRRLVQSK